MADPSLYTYPSPLAGYENATPLPKFVVHVPCNFIFTDRTYDSAKAEDGKSFVNPPAEKKSEAYDQFVAPIDNGRRGGFE